MSKNRRKIGLDVLRSIAIILVMFRHSNLSDSNLLKHFGWLGVDLFFVLSGYLISNILFKEYKINQTININKFLTRRGFKIFPPFYFFIFSTILIKFFIDRSYKIELANFLSEIFYLQSYFPRMWTHTWSLAVEEHFYLLFSVSLLFVIKKQLLENRKLIIGFLVFLLVLSFVIRLYISYPNREEYFSFMQTHLRADGIILGIFLSYLLNFTTLMSNINEKKWLLWSIGIFLIAPGFYFSGGGFFMNTIGLSVVNIGFAIIVLMSLNVDVNMNNLHKSIQFFLNILAFIGINSYSIYLWHIAAQSFTAKLISPSSIYFVSAYIILAIFIGIVMSYLIEKPSLKIRDYSMERFLNNKC